MSITAERTDHHVVCAAPTVRSAPAGHTPPAGSGPSSSAPLSFGPAAAVVGADEFVPLRDGATVRYANFDYAASAPALVSVQQAVAAALGEYASVHRGAGYLSQRSTARFESARETVADFIDARDDDHVIFTGNTTDSINLLAACVPGEVVVLDCEHHANLLPWKRIGARIVSAPLSIEGTLAAIDSELGRRPAALLSVTGASNVTGEVLPLERLADIAHRHGARIAVDGAQLVPHRRISLRETEIDYLVFSGHKLYAPFGSGVLAGKADWLDAAEPFRCGGGASYEVIGTPVAKSVEVAWHTGPARHEAGSPNVLGAVAIAAACEAIAELGEDEIARHESYLTELLCDALTAVDGVRTLRIWTDSDDRVGIVAFTVDGFAPREVAEYLSAEHGIGVRDGKFCAHPVVSRLGCPHGAVRASIGLGTTEHDVRRFVRALNQLVATNKE